MSNAPQPAFIILTIDGLNTFMLGPYGNTVLETPAFNQIASSGITFDFALSHSSDLADALRHMLAVSNETHVSQCVTGRSVFVTDCYIASACASEAQFETIVNIQQNQKLTESVADGISDTRAAIFFSTALEALEEIQPGDLLWLHFSGLGQLWDSPLEMREQFTGSEDPQPYGLFSPPQQSFDTAVDDPDTLVSIQSALTAQVAVIDQLLEVFLKFVSDHPIAAQAHLALTSPRGYCLGGGGQIGIGTSLTSEAVNVPLFFSLAGDVERFSNLRSKSLVQNSLIGVLINQLTDQNLETDLQFLDGYCAIIAKSTSEPVFLKNAKERAIQNRSWKLIQHQPEDSLRQYRLYVKPDDRWDANDVSTLCPQVIEELKKRL